MQLRRQFANRKSISASEADDVESTRRRQAAVESKYRPTDVNGMYIANALLMYEMQPAISSLPVFVKQRPRTEGRRGTGTTAPWKCALGLVMHLAAEIV